MKKPITCLFLIVCGSTLVIAQETVATAGGESTGTGGTMSYTIGQVNFSKYTANEGSISQGVQQPYEISIINNYVYEYGLLIDLIVYPNPTDQYLKLKVANFVAGKLSYQLYDANGKLLLNNQLDGEETTIHLDGLIPSVYFLKVTNDNKEIKAFKIVKH